MRRASSENDQGSMSFDSKIARIARAIIVRARQFGLRATDDGPALSHTHTTRPKNCPNASPEYNLSMPSKNAFKSKVE
jgi:hypothetical protein